MENRYLYLMSGKFRIQMCNNPIINNFKQNLKMY